MEPIFKITGNYPSVSRVFLKPVNKTLSQPIIKKSQQEVLKEVKKNIENDLEKRTHILLTEEQKKTFYSLWLDKEHSEFKQGFPNAEIFSGRIKNDFITYITNQRLEINDEQAFLTDMKSDTPSFGFLDQNNKACAFSIYFQKNHPEYWAISIINDAANLDLSKRKVTLFFSNALAHHKIYNSIGKNPVTNLSQDIQSTLSSAPEYAAFLKDIILENGEVNTEIMDELSKMQLGESNDNILDTLLEKITKKSPQELLEEKIRRFKKNQLEQQNKNSQKILPYKTEDKIKKYADAIEQISLAKKETQKKYPEDKRLLHLFEELERGLTTALEELKKSENYDENTFLTTCEEQFKEAANATYSDGSNILDTHRGAKKIIYDIASAILGIVYGLALFFKRPSTPTSQEASSSEEKSSQEEITQQKKENKSAFFQKPSIPTHSKKVITEAQKLLTPQKPDPKKPNIK